MLYKKGCLDNKKNMWQVNRKDKEEISPCFYCKKHVHLIADYPALKIKASTSKNRYKKSAMKTTWDDSESESEEEIDTTNVCL